MNLDALTDSVDGGLEDIATGEGPAEPAKKVELEQNHAAIAFQVDVLRSAILELRPNREEERLIARTLLARQADEGVHSNAWKPRRMRVR